MSLAERLAEEPPPIPNNPCLFCQALDEMDDKDRKATIDAVYGSVWTDRQVLAHLHEVGFDRVRKSSLANHRQNDHSGLR